jgi:hypothetical protein
VRYNWPILAIALVISRFDAHAQSQSRSIQNWDSLAKVLNINISALTTPEFEQRKELRRSIQRKGYSNVLMDVLSHDAVSALVSFVKMRLHIEYSISHRPLSVYARTARGTFAIPLPDDWSFPADPWKKEQPFVPRAQ